MGMLRRKLLRTIKTTFGQFIALTLIVLCGVAFYCGISSALSKIIISQKVFYQRTNFADYYFEFVQAPESISERVEKVPGVVYAQGRIQKDVKVSSSTNSEDTARLIGYDLNRKNIINIAELISGRWFNPEVSDTPEVLIDRQYQKAKNTKVGDKISVIINRKIINLRVSGIARSPELMYKLKNSLQFSDRDGMVMVIMDEKQLAHLLGMADEVNQIIVKLDNGINQTDVSQKINSILKPYGVTNSYPRKDQVSHSYVQNQITTLNFAAKIMPTVFFMVTMLVQFILIRRLIKSQHQQIGILKALGYESKSIIILYSTYSVIVGIAGALFGTIVGVKLSGVAGYFLADILEMPFVKNSEGYSLFVNSLIISVTISMASGILASWRITTVNAAEAFHAKPPDVQKKTLFERVKAIWLILSSSWKMCIRSISRNKTRFCVATMGIALSAVLMVCSMCFMNSRDFMLDRCFKYEDRYDYAVSFNHLIKGSDLNNWKEWKEVSSIEPALYIPVSFYKVGSEGINKTVKDDMLIGLPEYGSLKHIYNDKEQELNIPEEGVILNYHIAKKYNLKVGDMITAETKPGMGNVVKINLLIRGINKQYKGGSSIVSLEQANSLIKQDDAINTVLIKSDKPLFKALEAHISNIPEVSSVVSQVNQKKNGMILMGAMNYFTAIILVFALIIGSSIVYNNSVMSFSERQRELASLKIIGWSDRNINRLLFNEILISLILGDVLGIPLGGKIGLMYLGSISNDTFSWPTVIYPSTYVISMAATAGFAVIGHMLAVRRVKNIDIIEVLKERD